MATMQNFITKRQRSCTDNKNRTDRSDERVNREHITHYNTITQHIRFPHIFITNTYTYINCNYH